MHSRGTCRKLEERGAEETVNRTAGGTDKVSAHMNASSYTDLSIRESLTTVQSDRREDGASRDPTPLVENGVTLEEGAAGGHAVPRQSGEPGGQTKVRYRFLSCLTMCPFACRVGDCVCFNIYEANEAQNTLDYSLLPTLNVHSCSIPVQYLTYRR